MEERLELEKGMETDFSICERCQRDYGERCHGATARSRLNRRATWLYKDNEIR